MLAMMLPLKVDELLVNCVGNPWQTVVFVNAAVGMSLADAVATWQKHAAIVPNKITTNRIVGLLKIPVNNNLLFYFVIA